MELLAPAGNFQALRAAVACGADAVYLGGEKYGARAAASNFDRNGLAQAVRFAHLRGVKVHLTLNTLLKDNELENALLQARYAHEAGVDAFIVQDLGFIARLRESVPDAVLHASTQMGVCNAFGAQFAQKLGCTRVVVARETLPQDIKAIIATGLETEVFCHGALCVAYSGNCYYSSLVSGCSGNRGRCLQLCRKPYSTAANSGYYLSAKDICLLDKIDELKKWGVCSLKIEGRMRSPEYVAETVAVYRAAIDGTPVADARRRLEKVFNRGGYCKAYLGDPTESVIYPKVQNHIGATVGKVVCIKNGKAVLSLKERLQNGDGVKYLRNGFEVGGGYIDGETTSFQGNVCAGDEVRLTAQAACKRAVAALQTDIPAEIEVRLHKQSGAQITLSARGACVTVAGQGKPESATAKALTKEDVCRAVGTLGGTDFTATRCDVQMEDTLFYPLSYIKDMRKRSVEILERELLQRLPTPSERRMYDFPAVRWFPCAENATILVVPSIDTLQKIRFGYDHVILHPSDYGDINRLRDQCATLKNKAILQLPFVSRGEDLAVLQCLADLPIGGVVANNVSHFVLFARFPMIGGLGLNKLNKTLHGTWIDSVESDGAVGGIRYAYGKPPLMHVSHCPKRTQGGTCKDCCGYTIALQDDKGMGLTFRRVKEHYCYGVLTADRPVNAIDKTSGSKLLDLTYADDAEIEALNVQMQGQAYTLPYMQANWGKKLQ